jgi:hypothetical protein
MKNSDPNIVKGRHADSDDIRKFTDESARSSVRLRSCAIGLGTYNPGWRWSTHAGTQTGKSSQNHVGYVVSGRMVFDLKPYLDHGVFRELKDVHYFNLVDVFFGAVTWPHHQDIAPETLLAEMIPADLTSGKAIKGDRVQEAHP